MTITLKNIATNYPDDSPRDLFIRTYVYDALEYADVFRFAIDKEKIRSEITGIKIWLRLNGEKRIDYLDDIEDDIANFFMKVIKDEQQSIMDGGI